MPIYVYKCNKCDKTIDVFQHSREPLEVCGENCKESDDYKGKGNLTKMPGTVPLVRTGTTQPARYGVNVGKQGKR